MFLSNIAVECVCVETSRYITHTKNGISFFFLNLWSTGHSKFISFIDVNVHSNKKKKKKMNRKLK